MKKQVEKQVFDNNELDYARKMLGKSIARWTDKSDNIETAIPGLLLFRQSEPGKPMSIMYEPRVCVITQGAKRVTLEDDVYVYDPHHFLLTSVDLPAFAQVIDASKEKPCLGLVLNIDQRVISQLMVDSNLPPPRAQAFHNKALGRPFPCARRRRWRRCRFWECVSPEA